MPSEDQSALQSQGLGNQEELWAANHRFTQGDHDILNQWAARQNPLAGETAPKYWKTIDPQQQWEAYLNQNPYSPENIAKQQYQDAHPMSMADYTAQQAALPTTVYGNQAGRFVPTNGPGGRGGQTLGGFVQLGGSKSQGPSFDQLGSGVKYDPSKAVWDNNYGWIMPTPQPKADQGDWITGALMTAASMAAGAVGIPPMALMAVQGANSLGNGASLGNMALGMVPSLIGAGIGGSISIPPEIATALRGLGELQSAYGAYNEIRQGTNPGGGALTLGRLAASNFPSFGG